jgi:hypothetical protein
MKHVGSFLYGWSRRFNQIFGVIYLLVGLAGLVPAFYFSQRLLGLMHVNAADNVLHLVVGLLAAAILKEYTTILGELDCRRAYK